MKKEKRYQILTRKPGEAWRFVAHGATYGGDEGCDIERIIADNGGQTKRIPL